METLKQADLYIRYAKGGFWTKLSLIANSYAERTGFLSDVRWDATFLLNVPIYEGGSTRADVQLARAQQIIAQLTLSRLKRDAERQVRTAYDNLQHTVSQVQAYTRAVALSQENYQVQGREYRQGLINNLELLQVMNALQSVQQQAAAAGASAKLSDVLFRISMGEGL